MVMDAPAEIDESTPNKAWSKDKATGKDVPPEHWESLAVWLASSPRVPPTQQDWATQNGLHPDSVKRIKKNPRFREFQEEWAKEKNLSPERIQVVLDRLYEQATQDWRAAQAYLGYCERFLPAPKKDLAEEGDTRNLTDDELTARLKALLEDDEFNLYDRHE